MPPLPGLDDVGYLTSDTLWDVFAKLDEPRRLVVLGGGPIGCELAQSFARLGSAGHAGGDGAADHDPRGRGGLGAARRRRSSATASRVLTGHKALRCEREGERKLLVVEHGGVERRIEFDALLCAVGRVARLHGLRARGSRHPAPSGPSSPTSTCRRCTPTSSPPATWPGPTSSRTPRRTRPGTRR
ncbi:MAG: FAD-dependent oxidoreductase [Rhodopseudomonas palustris]|nr:FAD-dependent oxidoreductase [Rhodopseudomonas palustris]